MPACDPHASPPLQQEMYVHCVVGVCVCTCRQELESARRASHDAQERSIGLARSEDEQRQRCASLEKDVARCACRACMS